MTHFTKAALLLASLALSACTNPDRFDNPGSDGALGGANGADGIDSAALDAVSDPSSPAYFSQTIGDRVLFAVDQSTLSDEARSVLAAQAGWLQANPEYMAVIEGHADEQGTSQYNLALGARRSNAARDYLVSQGVDGARLRTVTYGKERPLEVCSVEACYAKNRRAVTVISAGLGS